MTFEHTSTLDAKHPVAYTISGFCAAFGIGKTTAYKLVKDGELTLYKYGKKSLLLHVEGVAWLESLPKG